MDAAPSPAPPQPPPDSGAWPRPAQLAAAFLLGAALLLLGIQAYGHLHWATRPTELTAAPAHRIDLNKASRAELLQLPGVGPNTADRIEAYRRDHGGFRNVGELERVPGIGPLTMAKLRPWVCVEDASEDGDLPTAPIQQPVATRQPPTAPAGKKAPPAEPLDLNTATADELRAALPGIGTKLAQAVVAEREKGPFKSVDDLRRVHGIGPKTIDKLRPLVSVKGETERVAARQ